MSNITLMYKLFNLTRGRFFSVTFRKKNGKLRTLNGQTGRSIIRGGKYLLVNDVKNSGYRMVNLGTVRSFKCAELSL